MQTLGLVNKVICTSRLLSLFVLFKARSASFHSVCLKISKCYDGFLSSSMAIKAKQFHTKIKGHDYL